MIRLPQIAINLAALTRAYARHNLRFEARLMLRHARWERRGLLKVTP